MKLNRVAYFITPHGYGHTTRACAVMLALRKVYPEVFFDIFTQIPHWLFAVSLGNGFQMHELMTDVGLVQDTAMVENIPKTIQELRKNMPFNRVLVESLASQLNSTGCDLVICDIAALGIAVAHSAKLPSILIENFTWDWIYEEYLEQEPALQDFINYLNRLYRSASFHIRTEPGCSDHLIADLVSSVVGRRPRTPPAEIRHRLEIPQGLPIILITMGGIGSQYPFLKKIRQTPGVCFVIPGGNSSFERHGSLVLLPHRSEFYHPDLVEASSAVIGKLGYSTLAEAYLAGIPYMFIPRPNFRESQVMKRFVLEHMNGIELQEDHFFSGDWLSLLPQLLSYERKRHSGPDGGDQIAQFISAI